MSHTVDPDNYFQTSDSIAERNRKAAKARDNKNGRPTKLSSKVLAVLADARDADVVWVAESAGVARSVALSTNKASPAFRPPSSAASPLTSLALLPRTASRPDELLLAGSWSSHIYAWSTGSRSLLFTLAGGHTDFVKCIAVLPFPAPLLASGGADARIVLWDIAARSKVATLEGHDRGVLALAADPLPEPEGAVLWSSASSREILRWKVPESGKAEPKPLPEPLTPHETSVTALAFSPEADLWSVSADGTAVETARQEGDGAWKEATTLQHGTALRAIALTPDGRFVVTAGRDEDVWVWDAGTAELLGKFVGHADEVYGLAVATDGKIVSGSLDCTVRVWDIADLGKAETEIADEANEVQLTADEEAELAELMDD